MELARECGLVLDPWQEFVLDAAMGERADDSWSAAEVGLIAPRQNGKNGALEARELFGLAVLGEWIIHTSHLFPTTRESYARLLGLIESNPDVKDELVYNVASPASGYEMRFRNGGRIKFIARSRTSGRGLTGDLLVLDEAQVLDDDDQGALLPTIIARPGAQAWYQGSAPDTTSVVLHRIRNRGRSGTDPRLAYLEWSAEPDASHDDREAWAQANPALGIRITEEAIESELASMSPETFAREQLSISPELAQGSTGVIPTEAWDACLDRESTAVGDMAFALDVSPLRDWASFAAAGDAAAGGTHVEVTDHRPGTDWVVARAKELQESWGGVLAISAGSPAASLVLELEQADVKLVEVSNADHARACGALYDGIVQRTVRHLGQPELNAAVQGADRKFYGDSWLWDRKRSSKTVDISPLVAVTLARWAHGHIEMPSKYEEHGLVTL